MTGPIDWQKINRLEHEQTEALCRAFWPAGKRQNHEWTIGNLKGEPGDSLKIELEGEKAGLWIDFATGQSGNLLDAIGTARGVDRVHAAELIGQALGVGVNGVNPAGQYQGAAAAAGFNWAAECRPSDGQLKELNLWRCFSPKFCRWAAEGDYVGRMGAHWVFPVKNPAGEIVGVHKRLDKNKWQFSPTLKALGLALAPFVIGDLLTATRVIATESQWDAFSALDVLGIHQGEPVAAIATRGAQNAALVGQLTFNGELYGIGQNDEPGRAWLEALKAIRPFKFVPVPAAYHDLNDWIKEPDGEQEFASAFLAAKPYRFQVPTWLAPRTLESLNPVQPAQILAGIFCFGQIVAVQGASKARKTFFLKQLLYSIANGLPFLDFATIAAKALDIDLELQEAFIRSRFEKIQAALGAGSFSNLRILGLRGKTNLLDQVALEQMAQMIEDQAFRYFDIDPIYKLLGHRQENETSGVAAMLEPFVTITNNQANTFSYAHHYAKGDQSTREAIDRGSGSGVFARLPDAIFNLTNLSEPNTYRLEIIQRNFPEIAPFGVRWDNWVFTRDDNLDPNLKRKGKTTGAAFPYIAPDAALTFINPFEEITRTEYVERLIKPGKNGRPFCAKSRAYEILDYLSDEGRLVERKEGRKIFLRKP